MKIFETEAYIDSLLDIVREGREVPLTVVGHSMEPFLVHERDSVLLAGIDRKLQKGDIALFKRKDGQYILHRICAIRQDGFYFVGDNQNSCDIEGPIKREQICAVVHQVKRHGLDIREDDFIWRFFKKEWLWVIRWRRQIKRLRVLKVLRKVQKKKIENIHEK